MTLAYILILIFSLIFICFLLYYLIYTNFSSHAGAIYYPSTPETVSRMIRLAKVGKKDTVIDLGSGDGRILIEFAKVGVKAIGYEIDPFLVVSSRKKIKQEGLSRLAKVHRKSFWKADFNQATAITLYLFPKYMNKLQKILEKNLDHEIRLVSNTYEFPNKKYLKKLENVYLYKFP